MQTWYDTLEKPPLTPPDGVFSPVWTVLYISIAVAIYLFYRQRPTPFPVRTTALLAVHLGTNALWTVLFFGLQSPLLALLDIVLLDATLLALIGCFWRHSRGAAVLLVPYLLWVLFATYLNAMIVWLN